jgi:adenylate cyclase
MRPAQKFLQQHLLPTVIFFGAAFGLMQITWFQNLDNSTQDTFSRWRAWQRVVQPSDNLIVVGIDADSIVDPPTGLGRWPWDRNVHGDFLQLLAAANARVVTWDILFTASSPKDGDMVAGIKAGDAGSFSVVLGAVGNDVGDNPASPKVAASSLKPLTKVEGDRTRLLSFPLLQLPAGELAKVASPGFVNAPTSPDGIRRWVPLLVQIGDKVCPSLAFQTMLNYWHVSPDQVAVRLGEAVTIDTPKVHRRIPINAAGEFLVNWRHVTGSGVWGDPRAARVLSYFKLMQNLLVHFVQPEKKVGLLAPLEGRILLVGEVADSLTDIGPSPLDPLTPLVFTHANIIENLLDEDYARLAPTPPVWLGAFLLGLAGLTFFSKRKLRDHAVYSLGVPLVYAGGVYYSWLQWSVWLPLVGPVLGFFSLQVFELGRRVIAEQKAKQEIKGMFGTYVSPALVNKMIDSGTPPQLGGHDAEITAYFSDIQSFSTFSEKLGSGPLVELMNEYLTACTDIVQGEDGSLDKYIGDAVVAMFGAPIPLPDHAFRACVASQLVHLKLGELRAKWKGEGDKWPQIVWNMQTRIGLNSGVCMIGNMGSRTRFNYTMMGDNVNLAARMESGSKAYGAYTMVAEATKLACEKHGGDRLVFRYLDKIVVKGRSIPVPIYEIVGLKENVTDQTRDCLGIFAEGINRYLAQDWDGAEALFRKSGEIEPNIPGKTPGVENNPSLTLIKRCDYWRAHPPGPGWTGVYEMKEK